MSLFTDASLVVKPSLYKAGKLYAIKPGTGLADLTVTRNSVKWGFGPNGVLRQVAANVPLIEYDPVTRVERGLLVEPGATNLMLQSQDFSTTWTTTESSVTVNATTAPDGATTADKLLTNTNSGEHSVSQGSLNFTSGTVYTASCFFKAGEIGFGFISFPSGAFGSVLRNIINLSTGATSLGAGVTGRVDTLPNGWYRFAVTATATVTASSNIRIGLTDSISSTTSTGANATDGIFIWQAQLETGSVATSPIVTTGSTAARVADVISLTSASSLIGQTEGTLYAEAEVRVVNSASARGIVEIGIDNTNRYRMVMSSSSDALAGIGTTGGVDQFLVFTAGGQTGIKRVALAYAPNDVAMYQQGLLVGTDASNNAPASTSIAIGGGISGSGTVPLNGWIRSVALFPTRLPNATLATLTTL